MNGQHEEGFTLHWGCVIVGASLAAGAAAILMLLSWRWLWLVPAAAVGLWLLLFAISVLEDGWLAVTPEHVRRGVPATCSECGEGWDVIVGKTRFKTRCPICGHKGAGELLES